MYAGLFAMAVAGILLLVAILSGVEGDETMTGESVAASTPVIENEAYEWAMYWHEAYDEYADEFTALFNSYTYKVSKNGRSMVNGKFVAMPKGK